MANVPHIRISSDITQWGWYKDANTFRVFFHLLANANWKDCEYMGIKVLRGQLVSGRKKLAENLNISEREVRTALDHLKSTNEIAIKTTNKFSIITICKFDYWKGEQADSDQQNDQQNDQQTTSKRPANDQQTTTIEDDKINKLKINNNIIPNGVVGEKSADELKEMVKSLIEQNKVLTEQLAELKKKKERPRKEPKEINRKAREIFEAKYKVLCGEDYYWSAEDAGSMTNLLKRIRFSRKSKSLSDNDEGVLEGLQGFLDYIKDDFVLNHFNVGMLVNQYNSIVSGQRTSTQRGSSMEVGRIINEYDGNKFNKTDYYGNV